MPAAVHVIAGQPGAGNFVLPVIRRWLEEDDLPAEWTCRIDPATASFLGGLLPAGMPLQPWGAPLPAPSERTLLVVSATRNPVETAAVAQVRAAGGRVLQYLDAVYDIAPRIADTNGGGVLPDRLLVIDAVAREAAAETGMAAACIDVVGHPEWERVAPLPAAEASSVLFVSQPVADDLGARYPCDEHAALALILAARERRPDLIGRLAVLLHPRETAAGKTVPDGVEVAADADDALRTCGTVLGLFSTLLVRAAAAGRRVVSVQPGLAAGCANFDFLSSRGLRPLATDPDALIRRLADPAPEPALASMFDGSAARIDAVIREEIAA